MGERLAFERTGTRIYETLIGKAKVLGPEEGGPTLAELEEFHDEERRHFEVLMRSMRSLGADPTAQTPSADLAAVSSIGLLQIVSDPRNGIKESLHAILQAELADNDGWQLLIEVTGRLGLDEMAGQFRECLSAEQRHLAKTRRWVTELGLRTALGAEVAAAAR
jgi:ferritin-like protein